MIFPDKNSTAPVNTIRHPCGEIVKKLSSLAVTTSLSLLNMSYFQGRETAMNAGLDMTIGDFVFEFDSTFVDYTDQEIMDIYDQALSGFDIVILMKEHAFYYTYDRMKFIFILMMYVNIFIRVNTLECYARCVWGK